MRDEIKQLLCEIHSVPKDTPNDLLLLLSHIDAKLAVMESGQDADESGLDLLTARLERWT